MDHRLSEAATRERAPTTVAKCQDLVSSYLKVDGSNRPAPAAPGRRWRRRVVAPRCIYPSTATTGPSFSPSPRLRSSTKRFRRHHSEVTDDFLSAVMSGSHIPSSASDTGLPGGL